MLVCLAAVGGCTDGGGSTELVGRTEAGGADRGVVVEVVDGDTIELAIGGRTERVRLLGIDAPESVHPTVPVQCFGAEASAELSRILPPATEVRVERDHQLRDRYDRLLLYIYRMDDDLFVNDWLVRNGLADTSFYEPNLTRSVSLTRARADARSGGTGLWSQCDGPDQPLDESP